MTLTLERVYHDFDNSLRKFIHGRVANAETAEDILQEVYIKIHNNIGHVRDDNRLTPWIYQITRNAIIDQYRRARPEVELEDIFAAPQVSEPDIFTELAASVRTMLSCLPPSSRQALELAGLSSAVEKVFRLTRLDSVFRTHSDAAAAIEGLANAS